MYKWSTYTLSNNTNDVYRKMLTETFYCCRTRYLYLNIYLRPIRILFALSKVNHFLLECTHINLIKSNFCMKTVS